jgi:hypothetical protein
VARDYLLTLSPVGFVGAATVPCVTEMSFPAAVIVPVRELPVPLRFTERLIVPLPWPPSALALIQSVESDADHEQVVALAVTEIVAVEPEGSAVTEAGVTPKVQAVPVWFTV